MKLLCAFLLGFVTASAIGNLIYNPDRPVWMSIVSLILVLYFLAGLLRRGT